jgi:hypothetical protein
MVVPHPFYGAGDRLVSSRSNAFVVRPHGAGFSVQIDLAGQPPQERFCLTEGEANRFRLPLSDKQVVGMWVRGRAA